MRAIVRLLAGLGFVIAGRLVAPAPAVPSNPYAAGGQLIGVALQGLLVAWAAGVVWSVVVEREQRNTAVGVAAGLTLATFVALLAAKATGQL